MSRTPLLNTQTLSLFSRRLLNYPTYRLKYQPNAKNAAVLLPICHNEHSQPSVLFTVRNLEMRTHKGEVSFPGGKQDPADGSVEETALRETMEEIGIAPKDIDILGQFSCIPNQSGSLRVHPFVGYVRKPVNASLLNCNPEEVARAFCLPLEYLLDPSVRELRQFRNTSHKYTVFKLPEPIESETEIWGMTSFILDGVLRKILPEHYT